METLRKLKKSNGTLSKFNKDVIGSKKSTKHPFFYLGLCFVVLESHDFGSNLGTKNFSCFRTKIFLGNFVIFFLKKMPKQWNKKADFKAISSSHKSPGHFQFHGNFPETFHGDFPPQKFFELFEDPNSLAMKSYFWGSKLGVSIRGGGQLESRLENSWKFPSALRAAVVFPLFSLIPLIDTNFPGSQLDGGAVGVVAAAAVAVVVVVVVSRTPPPTIRPFGLRAL